MTQPHHAGMTSAASAAYDGLPLPDVAVRFTLLKIALAYLVAAVACAAVIVWVPWESASWIAMWIGSPLILIGALIDLCWLTRRQVRSYRYEITSTTVSVSHGIIVRSASTMALVQLLNVEVVEGPLARAFGLATLKLGTIGDGLSIGPIVADRARQLQAALMPAGTKTE